MTEKFLHKRLVWSLHLDGESDAWKEEDAREGV